MRLTSKGRYAVRAMLDLTFHSNGNPVRLQEISTRQAISLHYLEQLFRKLRTGRVVKSVRGPGGGYVLARSMDEISIKDVLECVGENINPAKDISGLPSSGVEVKATEGEAIKVDTTEFNLTKGFFENLGVLMQEYLSTTTLGDLSRKSREISIEPTIETATIATAENHSMNDISSVIRPAIGEVNQ
ncbi:MAG: Rrf2 family transcriptional regulator [Halobacteriovoraceae bacterium]|jgi:Rrf2 family transcriptional regulator, iron-sulfur cluster assembly transcription factor|nr:Rrf2 family transcriptional regulator [Halobacteriovoraceae bacterium]